MITRRVVIAFAFAAAMLPSGAFAQGLLGGVLDGGGLSGLTSGLSGIVGGSGSPISVGGSNGLISANIGGGGSRPLVGVSVLGPSGIADVRADLGDVGARVTVGGPGLLDVDIDLPNGGNGGDGGNGGNGGAGGGSGGPGGPGTDGSNGSGGGGGSGGGYGGYGLGAACEGMSAEQLLALFRQTTLAGWRQANSIQLIPIPVCQELRQQIAAWLVANPQYHSLVGAVAQDMLINAALSRSHYQPGHVLGVRRQGQMLMVYVF